MEEVKKTKTTAKKKEEKKVEKKTVKKAAPKKEAKTTKTVKKTTKKEEPAKKATTKKVVKKETPKKEEKKVEKKTGTKKITLVRPKTEEVVKKTAKKPATKNKIESIEPDEIALRYSKEEMIVPAPKKKAITKKTTTTKKEENRFMPTASEWENIESKKDEIESQQYIQKIYDSVYDYFYGEPYIGAELKFDPSWETSDNPAIRERFNLAKSDALSIRQNQAVKENNKLPRQVEIDEYSLTTEIATTLHNNWCDNEIKEFFERAKVAKGNLLTRSSELSAEEILNAACYKKGKKTNEVSFDPAVVRADNAKFIDALDNFDLFKELVGKDNTYVVEVRKYAKRNINDSEKQNDFKASTGEENILRPYEELSMISKNENIAAAGRAVDAYKELASAGKTLDDMRNDEKTRTIAGKIMHIGYLEDNKNDKTYFNDLSNDVKEKNLLAFDTLINVVENAREYTLYPVRDVTLPDYDQIEKDVINGVDNHFLVRNKKSLPQVKPTSAYEVEKMIEAMEKGVDVLGEGEEEKNKTKINTMGYVGVWMVAVSTAAITAGILTLAAFYLK